MAKITVEIPGREQLTIEYEVKSDGQLATAKIHAVGNWQFLRLVQEFRSQFAGTLETLVPPEGCSVGHLLIREAVLRAQGKWSPPYVDEELCHCRAVPTSKVELAILGGAHTPRQVSYETSASTACGTCRGDVEALIAYRLGSTRRG
jgi:bacterioferritin-associated ferredoxin